MGATDEGDGRKGLGKLHTAAGWAGAGVHGQVYLADPASCASTCHGADLSGGFSGVSCTDCHSDYPHPQGWRNPPTHGEPSRQPNALARCSVCHGGDFQGGFSGVGCLSCHPLYPHEPAWSEPRVHGAPVLAEGPAQAGCATSCHGTDFLGGFSRVSCKTCHADYPHGADWIAFDRHGAAAASQKSVGCAGLCHGTDFNGGDTGISCFECHSAYPHVSWSPFTKHYAWVRQSGEASCLTVQGCHNNFRGPVFSPPPDCTSLCHRPSGEKKP